MRIAIAITAFLFVLVGCQSAHTNADPTPQLIGEIGIAGIQVSLADQRLAMTPPDVVAARSNLDSAKSHIAAATVQSTKVSEKFNQVEAERVKAVARVDVLEKSYWSVRQKKQFWTVVWCTVGITVAIGALYVWSLSGPWFIAWFAPAVSRIVRMFVTGFVPECLAILKWVVGLFRKKAPVSAPSAMAGVVSQIFPQAKTDH